MKVMRSEILGFCFGVSNTVNKAMECLETAQRKGLPCYSIGELIHNRDVVDYFEGRGMRVIDSPLGVPRGVALVRAHGIPDSSKRAFLEAGFELVDSTCPTVLKGADAIRDAASKGRTVIVLGFAGHAETIGLQGVEDSKGKLVETFLVSSVEDAFSFIENRGSDLLEPMFVVTQTTFPRGLYEKIGTVLKSHFRDIGFGNVPCPACKRRMDEALAVSRACGAAVVVGGRDSSNARNLASEVENAGRPVFFVENAASLDEETASRIARCGSVALLSGSSTPMWVIDEVESKLKGL